ncbi:NAD-dependent epimerase/dehydratase family protein [Chryseolinea lacunae]|uniref:NAD-dependent epimerase/dehydratase family protein n=1 Tax=Chryseolinea lacunae TaxID=2801331 RepID=A0ABS1KL49_9BACT|nr:NAD-dependent epimerase/dehydratase family protein [Chryseolinea lacunae]MBL0740075.1 NAD-dependent epimerase/dehydratase family protein [Chryseolinea lacunae]
MIAVTGANGLLGSFIVRELIAHNQPFVALKRSGSDTSLLNDVAHNITWRDADVLDAVALTEAFQDVTHVFHTAAIVSFNPRRAKEVMDINVQGTRHVVNACLMHGVKRLVHISSVSALGRQKDQRHIDESNKWVDSPLNSVYGQSKYFAELEVFRAQEEGLSTVMLNPSVILAPADWARSSAQLFKYVWDEKKFYIDGYLNYVDVRDVASLSYQLLNHPAEAERFIASAGNITFSDFFSSIARKFNKKSPSIKLSKNLLSVVASFETFRSNVMGTEPLITKETARLAGTEFLYDNAKVRKGLNFEFQPFDKTLQWCCEYYTKKNEGKK